MSMTKRLMELNDSKKRVAQIVAVRVDLLEECEFCGDVIDPLNNNFEEAEELADDLVTKGDQLVAIFNGNRDELKQLIRECVDEQSEECHCSIQAQKD